MYIVRDFTPATGNTSDTEALWSIFRLDPDQNMASVMCQWFLQAIVLLLTQRLLYGGLKDDVRLKAYVFGVNVMCLLHTVARTVLAFDYNHDAVGERITASATILPIMITVETMVIQVYFLFRCWNILGKRKWAMVPLISLWILSGVAGISFGLIIRAMPTLIKMTMAFWVAFSFSLDVTMTVITMAYLIKRRRESTACLPVLMTIWNMLWLAAIPPMLAMIALTISTYILDSMGWATFIYDLLSKLFVLSFLIALAGREFAASKLKQTAQIELNLAAKSSLGRLSGSS